MTTATIYTKPGCVACTATEREFDKLNLSYTLVDLSVDDEAHEFVLSLGYIGLPAVVAGPDRWVGHRPDRIRGLLNRKAG